MVDLVLSNQTLCLIHIEISDKFHWSKLNEHLLASNLCDWHNIATFDYLPFIIFYIIFISYSWISEKSDGFQCYLNSVHKKHFAQTLKCSSVEAADRVITKIWQMPHSGASKSWDSGFYYHFLSSRRPGFPLGTELGG